MYMLNKIERFIFESVTWKFILVIAFLTLFKTGIWVIPNLMASQLIAQNPFSNPFQDPNAHYLFWSWLGPYLAWLIGANETWEFFVFHLIFSFGFSILFTIIVFKKFPSDVARSSLVIFSVLPVSATAYFWVSSDSLTLFLMILVLAFPRYLALTFGLGVLLGMQHFEQSFFAAAGLLFAIFLSKRQNYALNYSVRFCLSLLIGVVAGKLLLFAIFDYYSIEVNSGRKHWLRNNIDHLLNQFFFHFHYVIWSFLGLGWLVALKFTDWGHKSVPFFITLGGLCLLLPVSGDQTRVLAIITFPLVTAYWLFNIDFLEKLTRKEISVLFTIWITVPWGWVWEGIPRWSAFPYDIVYGLNYFFGWLTIPQDYTIWPFLKYIQ